MEDNAILHEVVGWHQQFEDRPPLAHLCCPKVHDEDPINYEELDVGEPGVSPAEKASRIQDFERRFRITYKLSILMVFGQETAGEWLENWKNAVESCLTKCDSCVVNWHSRRETCLNETWVLDPSILSCDGNPLLTHLATL